MNAACKLCQLEGQLKLSHLMPCSVYRLLRHDSNKDPALFTPDNRVKASRQIKDYLLCGDCEKRFDEQGERYVMNVCLRGAKVFRLYDFLQPAPVSQQTHDLQILDTSTIQEIDATKISYFAASVIWRAAIHNWNIRSVVLTKVRLGPYEEIFRKYLLGQSGFPLCAALLVSVANDKMPKYGMTAISPYSVRLDNNLGRLFVHRFSVPGITFDCLVGKQAQHYFGEMCFMASPQHFIIRRLTDEDVLLAYKRLGSPRIN